jgi:hypothetical protein
MPNVFRAEMRPVAPLCPKNLAESANSSWLIGGTVRVGEPDSLARHVRRTPWTGSISIHAIRIEETA